MFIHHIKCKGISELLFSFVIGMLEQIFAVFAV